MFTFIAYHSQTNEQSKRINQIIEIIFKFHLTACPEDDWIEMLFFLQIEFNNVKQFVIDYASNELVYEFKINDSISMLVDLTSENYNRFRQIKRENAEVVITFANAINKSRYDQIHRVMKLTSEFLIYLRLHQDYTIFDLFNKKLFNQRVDSFKILKTVDNNQIYCFQLSFIMKIHSVIFITQLKSITSDSNLYDRKISDLFSMINEYININVSSYEIKRLLNKRVIRNKLYYLIKWKNFGHEHNVWYSIDNLNNVKNFIIEFKIIASRWFIRNIRWSTLSISTIRISFRRIVD